MCADESHEFCNTFSLTMMCRVSKEGDLLDHNEEELTSINKLVEDIAGISSLNEKAKVITIQAYPGTIFPFSLLSTVLEIKMYEYMAPMNTFIYHWTFIICLLKNQSSSGRSRSSISQNGVHQHILSLQGNEINWIGGSHVSGALLGSVNALPTSLLFHGAGTSIHFAIYGWINKFYFSVPAVPI